MSSGLTRQNSKLSTIDSADIVIIGNGIAGQTAAIEARQLAPDKSIVMITEQNHPTINTPALKQFAIGKLTREQLLAFPAGTERAQRIHVINARVEEIHAQGNYVYLAGGRGFGYKSLLIATGSTPTGLPASLPGRDFDGVLTLHRLNDYLDLRRRLSGVDEAVVIGGGPHAVETVMSLLYWGINVHWLIRSETFLPRMLDRPASDMVIERIRRVGASVYTETEAMGIVGRVGVVAGVVTNQHELLPCQLVLVCTGTTPVTTLAHHCDLPLQHKQGILVDNRLRTSVRNVYAAGDVAALQDPQTGRYVPRAQWYAAVLQGRIVAGSMAGSEQHEEGFGVPWHATRLGELSMLTVGNPLQWLDSATILTDSGRGSYRRISIIDDRLVGYLALGPTQPDGLAIKRLIDQGLSIRDIKKELLKGEFDARKYFSRQRTYAAQHMVSTGKLPSPVPAQTTLQTRPHVRPLLETGPLASAGTKSVYTRARVEVNTNPALNTPVRLRYTSANTGTKVPEQSTLITGDNWLLAGPGRPAGIAVDDTQSPRTTDTLQESESIPSESEALFFESGIAPHQEIGRPADRPHVIESTLVPLPENAPRSPSGSLWSYSAKLPALRARRSLWSYTDKHAAVKKGS